VPQGENAKQAYGHTHATTRQNKRRRKRLHILQHRKTALVSTKIAAVVGDIWTLVAVT